MASPTRASCLPVCPSGFLGACSWTIFMSGSVYPHALSELRSCGSQQPGMLNMTSQPRRPRRYSPLERFHCWWTPSWPREIRLTVGSSQGHTRVHFVKKAAAANAQTAAPNSVLSSFLAAPSLLCGLQRCFGEQFLCFSFAQTYLSSTTIFYS